MLSQPGQMGLSLLVATDHTYFLFVVCSKGVKDVYSSFFLDVDTHKSGYENITNVSFLNTLAILSLFQVNIGLRITRSEVLRKVVPLLQGPVAPMMLFLLP